MNCRLFGTKPLPEPMLIVNWALRKKRQENLNQNSIILIQENTFRNVISEMKAICLDIEVFQR